MGYYYNADGYGFQTVTHYSTGLRTRKCVAGTWSSWNSNLSNKTGVFVFPATNKTGLQTVDVSFGETLSTKPSVILLQLTDTPNTISYIENHVVLRNSISTTGFSACANRLNASYDWYCFYIAFY